MHTPNHLPGPGDWTFVRACSYDEYDSPMNITRGVAFDEATHVLLGDPQGILHLVPVRGKGRQRNGATWILTGDADSPTLLPSIQNTSWHGWIKRGEMSDA